VTLQSPDRCHQHHGGGVETRRDALDVEELLRSQVEAKTGLRDRPVGMGACHLGGDHRVAAVRDIGEGPTVNECRYAFAGLDQVGHHGVSEQNHHRAHRTEVRRRYRLAPEGEGHQQPTQALAKIVGILGQTENRHHLGGGGDVEPGLPRYTL
jgi:hypothetical protein